MTIVEALTHESFLSGKLWARSVLWRSRGLAWRILAPYSKSILPFGPPETPMEINEISRYTSEWELVKSETVLEDFNEWNRSLS